MLEHSLKQLSSRFWRRGRPDRRRAGRAGDEARRTAWRTTIRGRIGTTAIIFGVWTAAIEARLIYLQVIQYDELVARAERQQNRTITPPAKRGDIVDRHGRVLARSVDADTVYAVPSDVNDAKGTAAALCRALDACAKREEQRIAERLSRPSAFAYVRRQVSPEEADKIARLNLNGIGFIKENRRYYPNKDLAAHLLGYVGIDNQGLNGIESTYDSQVRGQPGRVLIQTDARGHAFSRLERPPTAGVSLELTIDQYLQHIAERELRAGVEENKASGGSVVIMDPFSGEILALVNEPTFNPNAFGRADDAKRRNRAIQDVYEPGSTFKLVTASAALEEHVMAPADIIDTNPGRISFPGRRAITEAGGHNYGALTFEGVIVKSSNIGAIKIGLKLGPDRLGRYVRRFGFGQVLSPDFQGQSPGIVWDASKWNDSALASISMGYQIGVTPLQMVAAYSSIASGGELVEPHVVRAIARDGKRIDVPRKVIRRTTSATTAATLTTIMEGVVSHGTAKSARLDGYTVAGKTGTAAKLVDGRYSKSEYNASFVGFLPSRNPVVTILVVIDTPRAGYTTGGSVAAPVFKRIAEATMRQLSVTPNLGTPPAVLVASQQEPATIVPARVQDTLFAKPGHARVVTPGVMPDVQGLGAREALRVLARVGVTPQLEGVGVVVAQDPPPGTPVDPGSSCALLLERRAVVALASAVTP